MSHLLGLLLLTAVTLVVAEFDVEQSLTSLCKNEQVELSKISEVRAIIELLETKRLSTPCSQEIRESILELLPVISESLDDVCSDEKIEQIRSYHYKYIYTGNKGSNSIIPSSLRNFFLAFGLKASSICKKNMINNLILDTHEYLNAEDFAAIDRWTSAPDNIFDSLSVGGPSDYDDIILATELKRMTSGDDSSSSEKIFIQTGTGDVIKKMQKVCERRFKPFYEKLILPLVALSNMGYNFQGEELERELREMKTNKEIHKWYKVVHLCELATSMEIVEDEEDKEKTSNLDRRLVRILTKDEADAIMHKDGAARLTTNVHEEQVDEPDDDERLKIINYKPEGANPIEDEIVNMNDKDLVKLIKNFDSNKSESVRIRGKILNKIGKLVKDILLKGKLMVVSNLFKKNRDNQVSQRQQLVSLIDEYVYTSIRSSSIDSPVAGGILQRLNMFSKRTVNNIQFSTGSGMLAQEVKETISKAKLMGRSIAVILMITGIICGIIILG